jgi:hypothetical protein
MNSLSTSDSVLPKCHLLNRAGKATMHADSTVGDEARLTATIYFESGASGIRERHTHPSNTQIFAHILDPIERL